MIDYTKEDFTRAGQRYDVTYDTVGNHSMRELRRRPESEGPGDHDQKLIVFLAEVRQDDLNLMRELIDSGKVKPVVERTYPLSQTADAIRYLEQGHARGKVVINLAADGAKPQLAR